MVHISRPVSCLACSSSPFLSRPIDQFLLIFFLEASLFELPHSSAEEWRVCLRFLNPFSSAKGFSLHCQSVRWLFHGNTNHYTIWLTVGWVIYFIRFGASGFFFFSAFCNHPPQDVESAGTNFSVELVATLGHGTAAWFFFSFWYNFNLGCTSVCVCVFVMYVIATLTLSVPWPSPIE